MSSVIAITGASGSGKSTLTDALLAHHEKHRLDISMGRLSIDAYYRDLAHLSYAERDALNFDHPDAIEFELFDQHVTALKQGQTILEPIYDFAAHTRAPGGTPVIAPQRLLIEGLLLGAWGGLRACTDVLIFVDTPLELCFQRRLKRDREERGRSEDNVRRFWQERALPGFLLWRDRVREQADLVISGDTPLEENIEQIVGLLDR